MSVKLRPFWTIYTTSPTKPGRLVRYTSDEFPTRRSAVDYIGEEPAPGNVWRILYMTRGSEIDEPVTHPDWGEESL